MRESYLIKALGVTVTDQDPMGPSQDRCPPPTPTTSASCLSSAEKHQRINLIREVGRCRSKGKQSKMTIILYWLSKVKDLNFLLKGYRGLPRWLSGQESTCQCRPGFSPWVGKIPWRRKWQPSPVFLRIPWTEEPGGLKSMGSQESDTTEHRHTHTHTHKNI